MYNYGKYIIITFPDVLYYWQKITVVKTIKIRPRFNKSSLFYNNLKLNSYSINYSESKQRGSSSNHQSLEGDITPTKR